MKRKSVSPKVQQQQTKPYHKVPLFVQPGCTALCYGDWEQVFPIFPTVSVNSWGQQGLISLWMWWLRPTQWEGWNEPFHFFICRLPSKWVVSWLITRCRPISTHCQYTHNACSTLTAFPLQTKTSGKLSPEVHHLTHFHKNISCINNPAEHCDCAHKPEATHHMLLHQVWRHAQTLQTSFSKVPKVRSC